MEWGILNISDLNENFSLSAQDYLDSEDYVTCKICHKIKPVEKVYDEDYCSKECSLEQDR